MSVITDPELVLLRSHPQETELWLSIYKPTTVLSVQLNNPVAAPGDRVIIYDNVFEGWYISVESGMTMYIGTTLGAKDVGRVRVRSATDSTITVAENSDIKWEDNLFLTIVKFWEIDAIYPRITATGTQTYWYKDYDIEYTNQNDNLGTFVCMGPHHACFLDNGTGTVYYASTGTHSLLDSTPLTYEWWMDGATVSGSSAATPGNFYYTIPGHYTTRLKVTDSNGMVDTSYRHVSIYNRPNEGSNIPILNWKLISLDGSRESGGWTARLSVREDVTNISDGALVIIFADDRYGTTKQSIGGNAPGRQSIIFVGYIIDGTIEYNYQASTIEFEAGSPTEMMKLTEGFAVSCAYSSDPSTEASANPDYPSGWVLIKDMNCERAIYHYLKWHSTVLMTNDFHFKNSDITDQEIEKFDSDRESLFDAVNNLLAGTLRGSLCSDRQGKLWEELGADAVDGVISGSYYQNSMILDRQDWMGSPIIDENPHKVVSYIEVGGLAFWSTSGSVPYLAAIPGEVPAYRGSVQKLTGLAISNQDHLNQLGGNVFAYLNARYPKVDLKLSGNYRHIDIAPIETVKLNLDSTDTPRGISWTNKLFHPTEMHWEYDSKKGTFIPVISVHEITQGFPGTTIIIPPLPPVTDPGGGGFEIPPIFIPPITIPGGGLINIYHNGVWVCSVSGINFLDDD